MESPLSATPQNKWSARRPKDTFTGRMRRKIALRKRNRSAEDGHPVMPSGATAVSEDGGQRPSCDQRLTPAEVGSQRPRQSQRLIPTKPATAAEPVSERRPWRSILRSSASKADGKGKGKGKEKDGKKGKNGKEKKKISFALPPGGGKGKGAKPTPFRPWHQDGS